MAKKPKLDDWLTLAEAAPVYTAHRRKKKIAHPEISPATLRIHCQTGHLPATKVGKTWIVMRQDVLRFAETNPGPGTGGTPRRGQAGYQGLASRAKAKRKRA